MSRMPKFGKGVKVTYDKSGARWRIWCHQHGTRWPDSSQADKDQAIAIAKVLERRMRDGVDCRPAKFRTAAPTVVLEGSVRDLGEQWLVEQAANNANNTTEAYDNALRSHIYPLLGDVQVTALDLTRDRCKQFARDLIGRPAGKRTMLVNGKRVSKPLAYKSREFICNVLGIFCEWAFDNTVLPANPAKKLGKHTKDKHELDAPIIVWTHAQAAKLLTVTKAWAEDWYLPLKFALKTGVRSAELVEVRTTDQKLRPIGTAAGKIALERQYLSVPRKTWTLGPDGRRVKTIATGAEASRISPLKGRAARTLDVWADLWAELETHTTVTERAKFLKLGHPPQGEIVGLLFTSRTGGRLDTKAFARFILPGLCRRAGIPVTSSLHTTRHTFATVLLTAGERLRYVSEQLGHKNESLTESTYKHWIPDHQFDVERGKRVAAAWGTKKP